MNEQKWLNLIGGLILIGVGCLFLVFQLVPGIFAWIRMDALWPLIIIGVGGVFLVSAVAARQPELAIPGCIIGGIGCLLFVQNATGYWDSWAYAWTLIPGFVGVGIIISGLLKGEGQAPVRAGASLLAISAILFLIFGAFLGPFHLLGQWWPILLILAGSLLLVRQLLVRSDSSV